MSARFRILTAPVLIAAILTADFVAGAMSGDDPVSGVVTDAAGVPLGSVRVELLDGERVLASALTDGTGAFILRAREARTDRWMVRAERLGYEVDVRPLDGALDALRITLETAPIPLAGFRVEGERDFCGAPDSAEARDLWAAASERVLADLNTLGIASYTQIRVDTVSLSDSDGPRGEAGAEEGQRASAPLLRLNWDRRVNREGYAFPVRRTDSRQSYDSWGYPPLEADFASHFASETFGSLTNFHVGDEGGPGWTLHFCSRRTDRPYVSGILEVSPDTLFQAVEWRFRTPEPDEGAGGWVRFPPPPTVGEPQVLLPTESITWRRAPDGDVIRRAQWYEGWHLVEGDSVPFLPNRSLEPDTR